MYIGLYKRLIDIIVIAFIIVTVIYIFCIGVLGRMKVLLSDNSRKSEGLPPRGEGRQQSKVIIRYSAA